MSDPQTEEALRARIRQQAVVAELGRRALAGTPPRDLLDYAVEAVAGALEVEFASVLRWIPEEDALLLRAVFGWSGQVDVDRIGAGPETQAGYTLSSAEPVVVGDHESEHRFVRPPLLAAHGVRSGISVVIPGPDASPYGVLQAYSTRRRAFTADDVAFMQGAAHVLAAHIERTRRVKTLRENEARVRAILDTTVDAIITIDERGRIMSFNRAAARIFGYEPEEVLGQNVNILMPEPYHSEHDRYIETYRRTGRRKIIGIGREAIGLRKDGTTFPIDLAVSEVHLDDGRTLFTGLVRDISERRRLEQEVLRISDEERLRIGQDLHDGLGQMLTGIGLIAQNLTRQLERASSPAAETAAEITTLIREADQMARGLARGLAPVDVEAGGLEAALRRLCANAERLFGITCTVEVEGTTAFRDESTPAHLFRIAQEAVSNAVRHGHATHVAIQLEADGERLRLQIDDDGTGFSEDDLARASQSSEVRGMGVRIMHYRARIIGGSLEIRRRGDRGTAVLCTIPPTSDALPLHSTFGAAAGASA